jgi:hypothetical protein
MAPCLMQGTQKEGAPYFGTVTFSEFECILNSISGEK